MVGITEAICEVQLDKLGKKNHHHPPQDSAFTFRKQNVYKMCSHITLSSQMITFILKFTCLFVR